MLARTVSLALITAIIACPLWCGNGLCHAGQCCSAEQSFRLSSPVHRTARCCDKSSPNSNDNCPYDTPCKSSCQGICGGAIFENPCKLDDGTDTAFLSLIAVDMPVACQLAECRIYDGNHLLCWSGNHGRFLRTLHMSFLC